MVIRQDIQFTSDVHLEFHPDRGLKFLDTLPLLGDIIVFAGDISTLHPKMNYYKTLERFAKRCKEFGKTLVCVAGNHDHWMGNSKKSLYKAINKLLRHNDNVVWLSDIHNPKGVEINGIHFIGAPLWFPWNLDVLRYQGLMNDYKYILGFRRWVHNDHAKQREMISEYAHSKSIVVTHHAPSRRSISLRYARELTNCFYYSEQEWIMEANKPAAWIHGHIHNYTRYRIGDTWVLANPRGYEPMQPIEMGWKAERGLFTYTDGVISFPNLAEGDDDGLVGGSEAGKL